jgi:hypothetical protein
VRAYKQQTGKGQTSRGENALTSIAGTEERLLWIVYAERIFRPAASERGRHGHDVVQAWSGGGRKRSVDVHGEVQGVVVTKGQPLDVKKGEVRELSYLRPTACEGNLLR